MFVFFVSFYALAPNSSRNTEQIDPPKSSERQHGIQNRPSGAKSVPKFQGRPPSHPIVRTCYAHLFSVLICWCMWIVLWLTFSVLLVPFIKYHLGCLKNVPLGLPQKCTTWVASKIYYLGCLRNVPLGLPRKSTTWVALEMYHLGCRRNLPLGLP